MADTTNQTPSNISGLVPRVAPGGDRTLLSAKMANAIIDIVNAVKKMQGVNGLTVTISDGNIIIDPGPAAASSGGGGTTINNAGVTSCFKLKVLSENTNDLTTSGPIISLTLTGAGTGYADGTYSLGFSGGSGTGASGTYTCLGGIVTTLAITANGDNYTTNPTVSFPSGGGTGATATCLAAIVCAKPTELQGNVATQTAAYSLSGGTVTDKLKITPPYDVDDIIYAILPVNGTNLADVLMDANVDAREWGVQFPTCESISGTPTQEYRAFVCSPAYSASL